MLRIIELFFLFAVAPVLLSLGIFPRPWVIYLVLAGIPIVLWLRFVRKSPWNVFWTGPRSPISPDERNRVLSRFGINAIVVVAIMLMWHPDDLLSFPAAFPVRWLAVMILYPLVMVYPQELFFRLFFTERYGDLLGTKVWVIILNGLLFGWAHMLFGNWLAVVLSAVGGALFMDTYLRTRSMKLVWLEHALYGNLIFTIGLGEYFYSGWAG